MMRVYKFLESKWALECIRKRRLKISLIPELNDPWEGRALEFENSDQEVAWDFMHSGFSALMGMLCFSKSWDNPLLWSHYGRDHTGMALGFDIPDRYPSGEQFYFEVNYVEKPKHFAHKQDDMAIAKQTLIAALSTKFDHWSYEQEVRLFLGLSEPDKETGLFFVGLGEMLRLREVIFGVRHSSFSEKAECAALARQGNEFICRAAKMSKGEFKMVDDPTQYFLQA